MFRSDVFQSFYHCNYLAWVRENWSVCFSCVYVLRALVCVSHLFLLVSGIGCDVIVAALGHSFYLLNPDPVRLLESRVSMSYLLIIIPALFEEKAGIL